MKKCPECESDVRDVAKICDQCGHWLDLVEEGFDEDSSEPPTANKAIIFWLILIVAGLVAYVYLFKPNSRSALADRSSISSPAEVPETQARWAYRPMHDAARGTSGWTATATSTNRAFFDFPYHGGTPLEIIVRTMPGEPQAVIFRASPGHFLCRSYDGCEGLISIDGQPETLSLGEPESLNNEILLAVYPDAIIQKLQGESEFIVELPFFQEGRFQFTFDVEPLVWPPAEAEGANAQ